jgi:hypothetical protein
VVAPAAAPAAAAPPPPAAAPAAPGPVYGVPVYAVPAPEGTALVVSPDVLDGLRDTGYVLAAAPAAVRIDLLVAEPAPGAAVPAIAPLDAETVLRRAVSSATLVPDPAARRLAAVGPHGPWYVALLIWGWLLLLFAAQNVAQVLGGLWLVAGLPLARRAFRNRARRWGRRGAAGWHLLAEPPAVRALPHAGLSELARVLAAHPDDPAGACRAAARACPGAGLSGLVPFYAALAAGETPPGVYAWTSSPAPEAPVPPGAPEPEATDLPAPGTTGPETPAEDAVAAAPAAAVIPEAPPPPAAGPAQPPGAGATGSPDVPDAPDAPDAPEAPEGEPRRNSSTPS